LLEEHTLAGQSIEMGCLDGGKAVTSDTVGSSGVEGNDEQAEFVGRQPVGKSAEGETCRCLDRGGRQQPHHYDRHGYEYGYGYQSADNRS
jgi:hypothetical protein